MKNKINWVGVFIKLIVVIFLMLVSFGAGYIGHVFFMSTKLDFSETITEGRGYDFVIGESKRDAFDYVKKLHQKKSIAFLEIGLYRRFPLKEAMEIAPNFDCWAIDYLKLVKDADPSIRYKPVKTYYVEFESGHIKFVSLDRFDKQPIQDKDIKNGMSKKELLDYLNQLQYEVKLNFYGDMILSDNLYKFVEDEWWFKYDSIFAKDFLHLEFKNDILVKIKRERQLVEMM